MAARIGRSVVNMVDFENAKDKVMIVLSDAVW